jgi:sugar phosphate isomerase/epimerase
VAHTGRFGISTYSYQGHRLAREHLLDMSAIGFDRVELFAARTHVDYHNPAAVADLQQWLADAGLELHSVHAPVAETLVAGRPAPPLTLASANPGERLRAMHEAERALHIARRIPFQILVIHIGLPRTAQSVPGENSRDGARRSVEALQRIAEPLGVTIAVEVVPNELSAPEPLVHFVEQVRETAPVGICLDFGHAHLLGDVAEAIETVSEHLAAAHVHDNHGRRDDHLLPFDGTIDWPAAMTSLQKVGYGGVIVFEVDGRGGRAMLERARRARQRMEGLLAA